jgi:RNA polymerase sigma-70 factor (ECF subfamily)
MAGRFENTSYGGSNSRFQTTEWTKIVNSTLGKSILTELYTKYWRPVYSFLRRKGFSNDQAKDLIQGFFSEKVLGQQMLQKADRNRGKFRTFLLTSISNYAIDLNRKKRPMKELDEGIEKSTDIDNPEIEFHIAWAKELLQSVLEELEAECRSHDKIIHWEIFRAWLLESNVADGKVNMSVICAKYSIDDVNKAYNMISNIKGRFRKILRRRLRHEVDSDAEVDGEINKFIQIFSRSSTR